MADAAGENSSRTAPTRPGQSPVLVIVVGLILALMIGLNALSQQFRPKSDEELRAEQMAKEASPTPAASAPAPVPVGGEKGLAGLSPRGVIGDAATPGKIVVGFEWTPQVQGDPSKVMQAVDALQKALPTTAHIEVVNVDDDPSVPAGVSVNGRVLVQPDADGGITVPPPAIPAISTAVMAEKTPEGGAAAALPPKPAKG